MQLDRETLTRSYLLQGPARSWLEGWPAGEWLMAGGRSHPAFHLAPIAALTQSVLQALAQVATTDELMDVMDAVSHELGFRYHALIHHDDLRGDPPGRVKLLRYPARIEQRIIGEATWRRDPVVRACTFAPGAFTWTDLPSIIALDRGDHDALEYGRKSGLNAGITVPFNLHGECGGSCTFAGTRSPARAMRHLGVVQMVGIFAFQAARRLAVNAPPVLAPRPRLHPRPRDCVVLAGRGQSNKAIARALSLSPRTVDGYMTEARELFGAHDRAELVVSALSAGEVGLHEMARGQPE
jgi:DNA-binding CsgD family transcriptional regulator